MGCNSFFISAEKEIWLILPHLRTKVVKNEFKKNKATNL
jgi:hypothetical protein